jgi:hypothetical protein
MGTPAGGPQRRREGSTAGAAQGPRNTATTPCAQPHHVHTTPAHPPTLGLFCSWGSAPGRASVLCSLPAQRAVHAELHQCGGIGAMHHRRIAGWQATRARRAVWACKLGFAGAPGRSGGCFRDLPKPDRYCSACLPSDGMLGNHGTTRMVQMRANKPGRVSLAWNAAYAESEARSHWTGIVE